MNIGTTVSQPSYKGDHELLGYQPCEEGEGRDVNNDKQCSHNCMCLFYITLFNHHAVAQKLQKKQLY